MRTLKSYREIFTLRDGETVVMPNGRVATWYAPGPRREEAQRMAEIERRSRAIKREMENTGCSHEEAMRRVDDEHLGKGPVQYSTKVAYGGKVGPGPNCYGWMFR